MHQTTSRNWAPTSRGRSLALTSQHLILVGLGCYIACICLFPLLRLATEIGNADADMLMQTLSARGTRLAIWRTLEASAGATLVSLALGVMLALALGMIRLPGRTGLTFLVMMPMLVPAQIAALAWLELTGPSSVILQALGVAPPPGTRNWLYSREGIILLMGIEHMPIVFLATRAGIRSIPAETIEAARVAGAGWLRVTATIILPLLRPSILAGTALAFVAAVGNFGIPAILGIPGRYTMLTAIIYQRLSGFGPSVLGEVAILSMLLAFIAGIGLFLQAMAHWHSRGAVALNGDPLKPVSAGRWGAVLFCTLLAILIPASLLPILALLGTSLVQALGLPLTLESATLDHYRTVWENQSAQRAFLNSAWLSLSAALVSLAIAVPFAWLMMRRRNRLIQILNIAIDSPFALPGIVVSIAFILTFLKPLPVLDMSIYNTAWIILLAYLARFLALGLRPVIAAFEAQDPALEEAAQIAGARPLIRLWRILLPLIAPATGAGALLIVMTAYNELTVSALLWSRGNETVGVLVFSLYDEGNATAAAAASVVAVSITLIAAGLATVFGRWLPKGVLPWQT